IGDGAGTSTALTKQGAGTFTLTNANDYTGGTTISNGTLRVDATSVATAGATSGAITIAAGKVLDIVNDADVANAVTSNGGTVANSAGAGTLSGVLTLSTATGVLSSTGGGLLVSGQVTGSQGFDKQGVGTVTLSETTNNYGGTTTISAGTLKLGASEVITNGSAVTLSNAGVLDLNGFSETIGSLASAVGTTTVTNSAAATTATLSTGGNGTSTSFAG